MANPPQQNVPFEHPILPVDPSIVFERPAGHTYDYGPVPPQSAPAINQEMNRRIRAGGLKYQPGQQAEFLVDKLLGEHASGVQSTLKGMLKDKPFSAAFQELYATDPTLQKVLGGDVLSAFRAMEGAAPAMAGGTVASNRSALVSQRVRQLNTVQTFQSDLFNRVYRNDKGEMVSGGNREATFGLSPQDAIDAASYAVVSSRGRTGAAGAAAAEDPNQELDPQKMMDKTKKMWETVSAVQEVLGSPDFKNLLSDFKAIEGVNLGDMDPDRVKQKFGRIGKFAAAVGQEAAEVAKNMAVGRTIVSSSLGMGGGTEYDTARSAAYAGGMGEAAAMRGETIANMRGATTPEARQKIVAQEGARTARQLGTRGGRVMAMLQTMKAKGLPVDHIIADIESGGSIDAWLPEIEKFSGIGDIRGAVESDDAFRETMETMQADMSEKEVETAGRETVESMNRRMDTEKSSIKAQTYARSAKSQMTNMQKKYGVTFTKEQKKAFESRAAAAALRELGDSMKGATPEAQAKTQSVMDVITIGMEEGRSKDSIARELRTMGPEGEKAAAQLESGYAEEALLDMKQSGKLAGATVKEVNAMADRYKVRGRTKEEREKNLKTKLARDIAEMEKKENKTEYETAKLRQMKSDLGKLNAAERKKELKEKGDLTPQERAELAEIETKEKATEAVVETTVQQREEGVVGAAAAEEKYRTGETSSQRRAAEKSEDVELREEQLKQSVTPENADAKNESAKTEGGAATDKNVVDSRKGGGKDGTVKVVGTVTIKDDRTGELALEYVESA